MGHGHGHDMHGSKNVHGQTALDTNSPHGGTDGRTGGQNYEKGITTQTGTYYTTPKGDDD